MSERQRCGWVYFLAGTSAVFSALSTLPAQVIQPARSGEDQRAVILMDNYHRSPEAMKLGGRLKMAGMTNHLGRYMLDDRVHGNGYSVLRLALSDDFRFKTTAEPITSRMLEGVDVLLIVNPDSTNYLKNANKISDQEIEVITRFVRDGGSLAVMGNTPESIELVQLNKLMAHFGMQFESKWTPFYENAIPADNQFLFDVSNLHYGGGCSIRVLDGISRARVEVVLRADAGGLKRPRGFPGGYPDKHKFPPVQGGDPIIAISYYGQGKVLAVGDSGTWALDDIALADADNLAIITQLFRQLRKSTRETAIYKIAVWPKTRYRVEVDRMVGGPDTTLLDFFPPHMKTASENYKYEFRYNHSTFELEHEAASQTPGGGGVIRLDIKPADDGFLAATQVSYEMTPQGKIFSRRIETASRRPFLGSLMDDFAVTFSDPTWKVGRSWENETWVRIVPLELGYDSPAGRRVRVKHIVDGFEKRAGADCAKIVTQAELDMRALSLSDLASSSLLQRPGISHFRIDEGMYTLEKEQCFSVEDGRLVDSESYLHYRVWLNGLGFRGDNYLIQALEKVSISRLPH